MILIIFAAVFVLVSCFFIYIAKREMNGSGKYGCTNKVGYITTYVKGAVRGSLGMFESNSELEEKRKKLKDKKSKF